MPFSPHYNKLQLKRRLHKGCWGFAFHANLLVYTPEIYWRTKSKNETLRAPSQGTIWKANGPMAEACVFPYRRFEQWWPWKPDGSSWQQWGGGRKRASSAPARCFQLFSVALQDGPAPKGHAALPSAFPFLFSERLWRPFTRTKQVFQMLVTSEQSQSIIGADYPPFQRSGAARRQPSLNLLFTAVIDHAPSLHSLKGAPALPRYITVWDKNGYCSPTDFWGFIFCWEYKGWCKVAFSISYLVFSLIQKVTDPLLTHAHVCFAWKSHLLTLLHYRVFL